MQSRPYKADRAKTGYALSKQASAMEPVVPCWRQLVLRWVPGLKPTHAWPGQRG